VLRRAIHHAIERTRIVDEKRQLRERLLQAEKLESLGVLAAGAAFGFNNLLGTILEQLDAALEHPEDAKRTGEILHEAGGTAFRAAQLASELRDYVRSEPPTTGPVDLSDLVLQASGMIEAIAGGGVAVHYDLDHDLPRVPANAAEIRHLLVNLVVNAAEAIGDGGGAICIATGCTWAEQELLAEAQGSPDAREGSYVYLRVRDSGPGIDPRALKRLFNPFFSTKFAGRGLGLSAAFGIVRRHGGVIHVGSPPRRGAAFTVLLPSPAAEGRAASSGPAGPPEARRVEEGSWSSSGVSSGRSSCRTVTATSGDPTSSG
jgi:signal transduction histidine kinase